MPLNDGIADGELINTVNVTAAGVETGTAGNPFRIDPTGTTAQPVSGTVTANAGANLNTSALALETTQAAGNVLIGAVTETAPGTDIASSGLNGRLQRIAQRISSLIALFPSSIGQKTSAGSLSVVLASDTSVNSSSLVNDGTLFSASADITAATSGVDNALLYLRNPIGSGKYIYIWRARLGSTVLNVGMSFKIFQNPTVTANGAALTILNRYVGGPANPSPAVLATTLPTVTTRGDLLTVGNVGQNSNSIDLNEDFAIKVAPGNSILITGNPTSNNRNAAVTIVWQEKNN